MFTATQRTAGVIFLIALSIYALPVVYNHWVTPFFHIVPSQDVVSASLVPMSILTRGNFYLDQYRRYIANNYPEQHFAIEINNHLVSITPITAGVLALPFLGGATGAGLIVRTHNVFDYARLGAAFMTALAVLAFFFAARELADRETTRFVTLAFAFGTGVWSTASQGLWQHTPSILFQAIAFWFLLRGIRSETNALAPAGMFLTLAFIARPPNIVTLLVFTLLVFWCFRNALIPFVLWALPPLVLALIYNGTVNGSPFSFGYQDEIDRFRIPRWESVQGLLFSPSRGLFIFSPFLLLAPLGLMYSWRSKHHAFFIALALSFIAYTGVMASWGSLGGWAYGARMLTDTLPALCLLIVPAVVKIRGKGRLLLWSLVLITMFVQMLGIYDYGLAFHRDPANSVWSIENNQPLFYLKLYISMIVERLSE